MEKFGAGFPRKICSLIEYHARTPSLNPEFLGLSRQLLGSPALCVRSGGPRSLASVLSRDLGHWDKGNWSFKRSDKADFTLFSLVFAGLVIHASVTLLKQFDPASIHS